MTRSEPMNVEVGRRAGVIVLAPKVELATGTGDGTLRQAVREALEAGESSLLIDLTSIRRIDSWGIGELVAIYTTVKNRGGKLALVNWPPGLLSLLEDTKLATVLDIYRDEEQAVAALATS